MQEYVRRAREGGMLRYRGLMAIVVALVLLPGMALAEPVGTFTRVEGPVDILRQSEIAAVKVSVGDPVSMGDAIRTKRNGKAEIKFRDETVIQLAPETRITIDEYSYGGADTREKGLIGLLRGKVRAIVSKVKAAVTPVSRTDASFNIKTPTAIAGVKGSELIVYYERGVTGVIFITGEGFIYNHTRPDKVVPVRGGQASFLLRGDDHPLDAQPVADSFIAPYLRDFPGSGPGATPDGTQLPFGTQQTQADQPDAVSVSVVGPNSTYPALANISLVGDANLLATSLTAPIIVAEWSIIQPTAPLIPVTETLPQLLPTPVSVVVTIP